MNLPITGTFSLALAVLFGAIFGMLLHRGRVVEYNVIVNQFRLRDFTVVKVMLTAVVVGGIGVYLLHNAGLVNYHIKSADMVAVILGAAIFGVGMTLYGYCPGTGFAAIGTGSIHALIGALGMLFGGVLYALSYPALKASILPLASFGKIRLPEITGIPESVLFLLLTVGAFGLFRILNRFEGRKSSAES